MGPDMHIISSAEETALEVADTLERRNHMAPPVRTPHHRFATTAPDPSDFIQLGGAIFGSPLDDVRVVSLEELKTKN